MAVVAVGGGSGCGGGFVGYWMVGSVFATVTGVVLDDALLIVIVVKVLKNAYFVVVDRFCQVRRR